MLLPDSIPLLSSPVDSVFMNSVICPIAHMVPTYVLVNNKQHALSTFCSETGSLCIPGWTELPLCTRLTLNYQRPTCFYLPSAWIKGVDHLSCLFYSILYKWYCIVMPYSSFIVFSYFWDLHICWYVILVLGSQCSFQVHGFVLIWNFNVVSSICRYKQCTILFCLSVSLSFCVCISMVIKNKFL